MRKHIVFLVVAIISLCFLGCEAVDEVITNGEPTEADKELAEKLVASADSIFTIIISSQVTEETYEELFEPMEEMGDLYSQAADLDYGNSRANFGASFAGFQTFLEHPDIKMITQTIQAWMSNPDSLEGPASMLTKNLFLDQEDLWYSEGGYGYFDSLNPDDAFFAFIYLVQNSLQYPDMIALIQNIIDVSFIPSLTEAIGHMDNVLQDQSFVFEITPDMTGEDITHEMDLGEVYMFSALMRIARGNLRMMNAYQLSIPGSKTTDYMNEVVMLSRVREQDLNDGNFLKLRNTQILPAAKQDYLDALTMIEDGVNFIKAETDDQINDLIKAQDLTMIDADIEEGAQEEDNPFPILQQATGLSDVITALRTVLSGPFTVEPPDETQSIQIDLSAFLNNGIPDLKDVLPYHHWIDLNTLTTVFEGAEANIHEEKDNGNTFYYLEMINVYFHERNNKGKWDKWLSGSFSSDGVLTVDAVASRIDYWNWQLQPVNAGDDLTDDGAFYLDSNKRFCITVAAYNTISTAQTGNTIDMFDSVPALNFSSDHPFGLRDSNGVFKFAGCLHYTEDIDEDEIIYLTDGPGSTTQVEEPIFPDPTFGGILPGMTQERLEDLFGDM